VVQVKVCGIRRVEEGQVALEAGADFLGFVFYPPSHRNLAPNAARTLVATIRERTPRTDWKAVGIFVNEPPEQVNAIATLVGLDYVQLHGTEPPAYCGLMARPVIKAVRPHELPGPAAPGSSGAGSGRPALGRPAGTEAAMLGTSTGLAAAFGATRVLLDAPGPGHRGGMGQTFDWAAARPYAAEVIVAGGLTPENVVEALDALVPWGVDASSGLERDGFKDPALIRAFLGTVRRWERDRASRAQAARF
jgi:phosphoribosylanthranilate isomerase